MTSILQSARTPSVIRISLIARCFGASPLYGNSVCLRSPRCSTLAFSNSSRPCSLVRASAKSSTDRARRWQKFDQDTNLAFLYHITETSPLPTMISIPAGEIPKGILLLSIRNTTVTTFLFLRGAPPDFDIYHHHKAPKNRQIKSMRRTWLSLFDYSE